MEYFGKSSVGSVIDGIRLTQSAGVSVQDVTTISAHGKNVRLEQEVVFEIRPNESIENNNRLRVQKMPGG